jgi:hypothetical protein
MAEDRVPAPVLTPTGLDIIRDARSEGAGIGSQAVDALLRRHDAMESALSLLLENFRKGQTIPPHLWDHIATLLFKEPLP